LWLLNNCFAADGDNNDNDDDGAVNVLYLCNTLVCYIHFESEVFADGKVIT